MDKPNIKRFDLGERIRDYICFKDDNNEFQLQIPKDALELKVSSTEPVFSFVFYTKDKGLGSSTLPSCYYESFFEYCNRHFKRISYS